MVCGYVLRDQMKRVTVGLNKFKQDVQNVEKLDDRTGVAVADVDTLALFSVNKVGGKQVVIDLVHLDVATLHKIVVYAKRFTSFS